MLGCYTRYVKSVFVRIIAYMYTFRALELLLFGVDRAEEVAAGRLQVAQERAHETLLHFHSFTRRKHAPTELTLFEHRVHPSFDHTRVAGQLPLPIPGVCEPFVRPEWRAGTSATAVVVGSAARC